MRAYPRLSLAVLAHRHINVLSTIPALLPKEKSTPLAMCLFISAPLAFHHSIHPPVPKTPFILTFTHLPIHSTDLGEAKVNSSCNLLSVHHRSRLTNFSSLCNFSLILASPEFIVGTKVCAALTHGHTYICLVPRIKLNAGPSRNGASEKGVRKTKSSRNHRLFAQSPLSDIQLDPKRRSWMRRHVKGAAEK